MITLQHAIKIASVRSKVFHALTDITEMAAWHLGTTEGDISPGGVFYLNPKPGLRFGWRTESLTPDATIVQTCVEGPGSSVGKILTFTLSDTGDGRTLVALSHGDWPDDDPHLPFCNTHWGHVLHRLQAYVEQPRG